MVFKITTHFWFNFMEIHYESIWFFLFPFSLNSLGLSLNRLGDNIGVTVTVTVGVWETMVVVGESMVVVGESWGLGLNSFDYRLHIGISSVHTMGSCVWEIVGDGRIIVGGVACKDSGISFSIGVTLLPLSLNSLSFGFSLNGLGDDIGISMIPKSVRVDSMVTKAVWVSVGVWVGKSRRLIFHLLYNRLNKWGVNIWVVKIVGISLSISLSIGLSISLSIGLTLPPFGSLHSGSLSLSGSSGSSGEWDGERLMLRPML